MWAVSEMKQAAQALSGWESGRQGQGMFDLARFLPHTRRPLSALRSRRSAAFGVPIVRVFPRGLPSPVSLRFASSPRLFSLRAGKHFPKDALVSPDKTILSKRGMTMRKNIQALLALALAFICLMAQSAYAADPGQTERGKQNGASNGVFEIIDVSKDRVKFKIVSDTKFYSLELMDGEQAVAASSFSNSEGNVYWANGSIFTAGSQMSMPARYGVGAMGLKAGTVMEVNRFNAPKDFKPGKVRFTTEGATQMIYDVKNKNWK
jgi:hypothetical protein